MELASVIGGREGGARGQREVMGSWSLWAPGGNSGTDGAAVQTGCLRSV
jgi:hypothetical protein